MDTMKGLKRTCYCGEVEGVGSSVTVGGYVQKIRDMGTLIFIDLRDRTGIVQLAFDETTDRAIFEKAQSCRGEYVLMAKGVVRERESKNDAMKTGSVEVFVDDLRILAKAQTPPFEITENTNVNEELRLKYRYLDLRRKPLQDNIMTRAKIAKSARDYFAENGFIEIETPMMIKSTPEGARDYIVPSRIHRGKFYALPQSPQIYKQLLMISGFDRYIQIARCFRDEDLRANRQPEFTQIDMEMSFVDDEEDVMGVAEGLVRKVFKDCIGYDLPEKIRRMTYAEAMSRFGSDKPDTRFGLELQDVSDIVKDCGFQVFTSAVKNGGSVRMINAKGFYKSGDSVLSRRDVDALGEFVKTYRARGLAWIAVKEDGLQSAITKFMDEATVKAILDRANAEVGDIIFFVADKNDVVFASLGALRLHLAEIAGLIDDSYYDILWITEFPMLEWSEEEKRCVAVHHPFTSPKTEDLPLLDTEPLKVRAKAYDLVINGQEAGGGSIRIHSRDIQKKMFNVLGFTDEQIEERFGFFIGAFNYGTPPHGGLAFGLDRLIMLLSKTDNIKDVIAFPKVQNASDLMTDAPSAVEPKQLKELSIKINEQ